MEKMKLIKYLSSSSQKILLVVAVFAAPLLAFATGGDEACDDMGCNSFFSPEIIDRTSEIPFFRSQNQYYKTEDQSQDRQDDLRQRNQGEWMSYYNWELTPDLSEQLIYKMNLPELENLTLAMQGKNPPLAATTVKIRDGLNKFIHTDDPYSSHPTTEAQRRELALSSLTYLHFAKEAEPIATRRAGDGWDTASTTGNPADLATAKALIAKSEKLIAQAASSFIKLKYRMQVERLYYYTAQYPEAQKYYTAHLKEFPNDKDNSTKYRFMDYGAGALYRSKNYGQANYIYSQIFDQFNPMKKTSYFSFHPMEEADWQQTLGLAQTPREKMVLWQLLGIYADGQTAIKNIYAIDPKSDLLPLLLVREVNIAEEEWSANQDRIIYHDDGIKTDLETIGPKRLALLQEVADAGKADRIYLWQISLGHLYALAGDLPNANKYLQLAANGVPARSAAQNQLHMSKILTYTRGLKEINTAAENLLAVDLAWLYSFQDSNFRAATLNTWVRKRLSDLYVAKKDTLRALLLTDTPTDDFYKNNKNLDSVMALINNPRTSFDRYLSTSSSYTSSQLQELKMLNYLFAGNLPEAVKTSELVGNEIASNKLNADPFMIHVSDCHDCDFELPHTNYTKVTFTEHMLELSKKAQGQGESAALASLELGNGYYNMTYYGNGRDIYDTQYGNLRASVDDNKLAIEPSRNMGQAVKAYEAALSKTRDPELKAKATWLLAKAEHNTYYNEHVGENSGNDINAGKYFKKLFTESADTQYYQEVIRECGYFKTYVDQQH